MKGKVQNIPIIPGKIFFSLLRKTPFSTANVVYFTIDDVPEFQYHGFFEDFGPPSILQLYQFVKALDQMLESEKTQFIFYTSLDSNQKSNSGLYITFFRMIHLGITPQEAFQPIQNISSLFRPFRDASTLPSTFHLTILDCLRGIYRAMNLGWFNMNTFDPGSWAFYEQILSGDMNWLIPGKLLAFASPYNMNILPGGYEVCTPNDIIPTFKQFGITHIVRLNKSFYDSSLFKKEGFQHTDLYFLDGSIPPKHILTSFLKIIEGDNIVALHCKAGLGRTYVSYGFSNVFL